MLVLPFIKWKCEATFNHSAHYVTFFIPASVRLKDGNSHIDGFVEIYRNGEWGRVCADQWDAKDARVACRQLGNYPLAVSRGGGKYKTK